LLGGLQKLLGLPEDVRDPLGVRQPLQKAGSGLRLARAEGKEGIGVLDSGGLPLQDPGKQPALPKRLHSSRRKKRPVRRKISLGAGKDAGKIRLSVGGRQNCGLLSGGNDTKIL